MESLPTLPARPALSDMWVGFSLPMRAFTLIRQNRKLQRLSALCSAVTFVTLTGWVALLSTQFGGWLHWLWTKPDSWYGQALWYLVGVLTFVVLLAAGASALPLLLLAPLQDPLSEATEELLGEGAAPGFSVQGLARGTYAALRHTFGRVLILLLGYAVFFPLHFIPGAGSVVSTVLSTSWTIWWLAGEYLSAPMARHLYRFRDVRKAMGQRTALMLGFGGALFLLLWVPILNFFLIPIATVGGTLLYLSLKRSGTLSPPAQL